MQVVQARPCQHTTPLNGLWQGKGARVDALFRCVSGRGESGGRATSRLKGQGFTCLAVAQAVPLHQEGNAVTAGATLAAHEGSTMRAVWPDNEAILRGPATQGARPGVFVKAFCFEELGRNKGQNIFIHMPAPH